MLQTYKNIRKKKAGNEKENKNKIEESSNARSRAEYLQHSFLEILSVLGARSVLHSLHVYAIQLTCRCFENEFEITITRTA
jgi:hypothetical protein